MKLVWTREKKRYLIWLFLINIAGIIGVIIAYLYFLDSVCKTYELFDEDAYLITFFIVIRIGITGFLTSLIFYLWLSQENPYLDDMPFLMGIFFLSSTYGKALDLLHNLIHFTASENEVLLFLKFRFLLIISSALPLLYVGLTIIFYIKEIPKEKIQKFTKILMIVIGIAEIIGIFLVADLIILGILLPIILFPPLLMVIIIFFFSYRQRRLGQVHPLILSVGFTLCLFSQILRPILQVLFMASGDETSISHLGGGVMYVLISEIVSIIAFIIIFMGLVKKLKP